MQCNIPSADYDGYLGYMLTTQTLPPMQECGLQPHYSLSNNNSPFYDEADDQQQQHNVADERKQRRMISNKESARRSRMRKQQLFDELWSQVMRLRNENHNLVERLNSMSVSSNILVEENSKLKEENYDLRQMLTSLQIHSPPYISLQYSEEMHCNSNHLRAATSNQSITRSVDFLH